MKRYEKFVLEAEKGITFEVSEGENGELIIKAKNKVSIYSENYANPPILKGYEHVVGEWYNGFVIERKSDRSQFVWIPVGYLDSNGTLDGKTFNEKFGRRNYLNEGFSGGRYHESVEDDLELQLESVKKYGGFYISRYNVSKNRITSKPQSLKDKYPWTDINYEEAKKVASTFEKREDITSHLTYGAEYDSILEWIIKSGAKTHFEVEKDSTKWGNYWNAENSLRKIAKTGSKNEWEANHISDLAGNVDEITQEKNRDTNCVTRGGFYDETGYKFPVANRWIWSIRSKDEYTGFRIALWIK